MRDPTRGSVRAPVPIIFPMVWDPGARPAWVRHAIAGEGGPIYGAAAEPFDLDQLRAAARARAGLATERARFADCQDYFAVPSEDV